MSYVITLGGEHLPRGLEHPHVSRGHIAAVAAVLSDYSVMRFHSELPRDPQVKVQIYNAEIVPGGYTNWHCHNGAAFFVALQGVFEAHFQEGVLVKAKAGECYSEPIAKFHRGHNPHPELPYLCIGVCFTSPDREHVTNSIERPW